MVPRDHSHRNRPQAFTIEAKITARLTRDQLLRHTKGVKARGFKIVGGLAITADTIARAALLPWTHMGAAGSLFEPRLADSWGDPLGK